jgi:SHS2 domain-containing protein
MNAMDTSSETGAQRKSVISCSFTSLDKTTLLIDFLSDILTASYERKMIFNTLQIKQLTDTPLDAMLLGYSVEQFDDDIKAVTYHEAEVIRNAKGNWETVVIFDI